jgi:hypothetical protein
MSTLEILSFFKSPSNYRHQSVRNAFLLLSSALAAFEALSYSLIRSFFSFAWAATSEIVDSSSWFLLFRSNNSFLQLLIKSLSALCYNEFVDSNFFIFSLF